MRPNSQPVLAGILFLCLTAPLFAAPSEEASDAAPPWVAAPFDAEAELELLDAVRMTLSQDPNLRLSQEEVQTRLGRALELSGAFDWVFGGSFNYEHREQELLESVKQGERDKRAQIELANQVSCDAEQDLTTKLADLEAAQNVPEGVDIRNDQGFDAQLKIIEALIIAAGEGAGPDQVRSLEETRRNLITTEIQATNDARLEAAQSCRETAEDRARIGDVPEEEEFDTVQLDFDFSKLTRSGVRWNPFFRSSFRDTQFEGKRDGFFAPAVDSRGRPIITPTGIPLERLVDFGGKNFEEVYQLELGFEVDIPLLRGRGKDAVAAQEKSAEIDIEASKLTLAHRASESVLNTVNAYWGLVAAQERVGVLERSVDLQESLLELTSALVEAEEMPGAELARNRAGAANARSQLQTARRDLVTAQLELVRAIGLTVDDPEAVPTAGTDFPVTPEASARAMSRNLTREAVERRLDLKANRTLVESAKVLQRGAGTELRPVFDVNLGIWFIARDESDIEAALDNVADEPSWKVGADYEKPIGNRTARGRVLQADSQVRQRQIGAADLERTIRLSVLRSLGSLDEAIAQLDAARAASDAFQDTIDSELEKLKVGETTVIDAILTEQQWTQAAITEIQARFQIARLIAQLRFDTGSLVDVSGEENVVRAEDLISLPAAGEA